MSSVETQSPDAPFFEPDSMMRRVHRESVLLLGGGRALLMQLAHPGVAAAVAEHSAFPARPLPRLLRTLRSTLAIVFGSREQALTAAARIKGVHRDVVGPGYDASDPALLLWVAATMVDSSLATYRLFVRPLAASETAAYYEDWRRVAPLLGLPAEHLPPDVRSFEAYVERMVASLEVGDTARRLAHYVFQPGGALTPALLPQKRLTAVLLPPRLRDGFGLRSRPVDRACVTVAAALSRAIVPRLPQPMRQPPPFLMPSNAGGSGRQRVPSP